MSFSRHILWKNCSGGFTSTQVKDFIPLEKIYIMSYTSYDSPEKKQYILSKGADCIVTKPVCYKDFCEIFNSLLNLQKL